MKDLISREALKRQFRVRCRNCDARFEEKECGRCGMTWAMGDVKLAPAVDAVEVVNAKWEERPVNVGTCTTGLFLCEM